MKKIGVFYSFRSGKTAKVASKLIEKLGKENAEAVDVDQSWEKEFLRYDNFIFGVPTWFDGELPSYWDELVPMLEDLDLKNKRVAIFGNGDQVKYSENFGDAVGIMADLITSSGAKVVGFTSTEGYNFEASKACRDNQFMGLILDFENQAKQNDKRIGSWASQLSSEFN